MPEPAPTESPSLLRRLAAMMYDTFLVLPLIMAAVAIAMGLQAAVVGSQSIENEGLNPQLVQLVALVTVMGFYTIFWRQRGQTLGMQAWRVQLQSEDGGRLSVPRCLLRCLGAIISLLCFGAGYWWCLIDKNNRYWHDYLSRSELILLPKKN